MKEIKRMSRRKFTKEVKSKGILKPSISWFSYLKFWWGEAGGRFENCWDSFSSNSTHSTNLKDKDIAKCSLFLIFLVPAALSPKRSFFSNPSNKWCVSFVHSNFGLFGRKRRCMWSGDLWLSKLIFNLVAAEKKKKLPKVNNTTFSYLQMFSFCSNWFSLWL